MLQALERSPLTQPLGFVHKYLCSVLPAIDVFDCQRVFGLGIDSIDSFDDQIGRSEQKICWSAQFLKLQQLNHVLTADDLLHHVVHLIQTDLTDFKASNTLIAGILHKAP